MARTTIDLDPVVLRELRRRQKKEGRTLGSLASELLARALKEKPPADTPFVWRSQPMGAKVDLEDKEAVRRALGSM